MEVWFIFVAASIVYIVANLLSRSPQGLPLGYLLTYIEFPDLISFFNGGLWCSHRRVRAKRYRKRSTSVKYWLFLALAVFLCLLSNFMGPSIAVIMIPTLDYWDSPFVPQQTLDQLLSSSPPRTLRGCSQDELSNSNYSCAYIGLGETLDSLAADAFTEPPILSPVTLRVDIPENELLFTVNVSFTSSFFLEYIPLRQVIDDMATTLKAMYNFTTNDYIQAAFTEAANSLELYLQRKAPVVAFTGNAFPSNPSTTIIDDTRQIRCYPIFDYGETECHRVGSGWQGASSVSSFFVSESNLSSTSIKNEVYTSASRGCLPSSSTEFNSGGCLRNGTLDSNQCDFDAILSNSCDDDLGTNQNLVWESSIPGGPMPHSSYVFITRYFIAAGTYSLEISAVNNPGGRVRLISIPDEMTDLPQISIDPTWILAGLSTSNGSALSPTREIASLLSNGTLGMQQLWVEDPAFFNGNDTTVNSAVSRWIVSVVLVIQHTATLIPYNFTEFYPGSSTAVPNSPDPSWDSVAYKDTPTKPIIWTNFHRRVWLFGIQGRRTAWLGIVVVGLGCFIVLVRTILKLTTRIRTKSPLELLVGALEHRPAGEFEGVERSESHLGRVRFGVREVDERIEFAVREVAA